MEEKFGSNWDFPVKTCHNRYGGIHSFVRSQLKSEARRRGGYATRCRIDKLSDKGTAIANWIPLRISSCRPGFESRALSSMLLTFMVKFVIYLSYEQQRK